MHLINVDRDRLLTTLRENREQHIAAYETAITAYRQQAAEWLRGQAGVAAEGQSPERRYPRDLPEPDSYVDEYDRAIAMAEWSTDNAVKLSREDFDRFVRNVWEWTGRFSETVSSYSPR